MSIPPYPAAKGMTRDPHAQDTANATIVATGTTKGWMRSRWTEITVYHFGDFAPGGKRWMSEVKGMSNVEGERTKTTRLGSSHLERCLKLIDDSGIGIAVKEQAREWAEENGHVGTKPGGQVIPDGERDALAWLMGVHADDLSVNAAAAALGVGESKVRMALREDRMVTVPLRYLLPFIDRDAFRAARCKEAVDAG